MKKASRWLVAPCWHGGSLDPSRFRATVELIRAHAVDWQCPCRFRFESSDLKLRDADRAVRDDARSEMRKPAFLSEAVPGSLHRRLRERYSLRHAARRSASLPRRRTVSSRARAGQKQSVGVAVSCFTPTPVSSTSTSSPCPMLAACSARARDSPCSGTTAFCCGNSAASKDMTDPPS